ncbi:hypothetical protein Tco_0014763 [Tanacetum coccineum]
MRFCLAEKPPKGAFGLHQKGCVRFGFDNKEDAYGLFNSQKGALVVMITQRVWLFRQPPRPTRADIIVDTTVTEAAAARESDVRVEVGIGSDGEDEAEEEAESKDRGTIKIRVDRVIKHVVSDDVYESASDDISESADERGLDALVQELHDHLQSDVMLGRIRVLERDNIRLRGMLCVERERVDSLRCHMSYTREKLRQICMSHYYDRAEFRRLETFAMRHLGYLP